MASIEDSRLDPKILQQVDKISLLDHPLITAKKDLDTERLISSQFNNFYTANAPYINQTNNRGIIIDGRYSRYFTIGFNRSKSVCYVGISKFFLEMLGLSATGLAWVNREKGTGVVYLSMTFKRLNAGKLAFTNQRISLPVYNQILQKEVSKAQYFGIIEMIEDNKFQALDEYRKLYVLKDVHIKDGSEKVVAQKSQYKKTNF